MADNKPTPKPKTKLALTPPFGSPVASPTPQPDGTPVIPPELMPLFQFALKSIPPGAIATLFKQHWKVVAAFVLPLVFVTWNNIKQIWQGPAALEAISTEISRDREERDTFRTNLSTLSTQFSRQASEEEAAHKKLDEKIERILWLMQTQGGAKVYPPSSPNVP